MAFEVSVRRCCLAIDRSGTLHDCCCPLIPASGRACRTHLDDLRAVSEYRVLRQDRQAFVMSPRDLSALEAVLTVVMFTV